eukprot:Gb_34283 [translate_table: standard]
MLSEQHETHHQQAYQQKKTSFERNLPKAAVMLVQIDLLDSSCVP